MLRQLLAQHGSKDRAGLVPFPAIRLQSSEQKSVPVAKYFTVQMNNSPLQMRRTKNRSQDLKMISETPLPSRAIGLIRKGIQSLQWGIQPKEIKKGTKASNRPAPEADLISAVLNRPNDIHKSWKRFIGPVIEDILTYDAGAWEYVEKPTTGNGILGLCPVAGVSIGQVSKWKPGETGPRWAQVDESSQRVVASFRNEDLEYLMMRERTTAVLGLSQLEVALEVVDAWLKLQTMQKTKGSETLPDIVNLGDATGQDQIAEMRLLLRQHAGSGLPVFIGGYSDKVQPSVLNLRAISDAMMLLGFDEHLMRLFGLCFDLSGLDMGIERDVNRSTANVMAGSSMLQAIRPIAELMQEIVNNEIIPRIARITANKKVEQMEFFFKDLSPRDEKTFSDMMTAQLINDGLLIDEYRAEFDREPLPGGRGQVTITEYRANATYPADTGVSNDTNPLEDPADESFPQNGNGDTRFPKAASRY